MTIKNHTTNGNASRLICEELEPRQLFSGGIEGIVIDNTLTETAIYMDVDSDSSQTQETNDSQETSNQAAKASRNELVFIDTQVDNYQELLNDILAQGDDDRNIEIVLLDNERDGVNQINEALSAYQDIDAIHIISHGSEGSIRLGNTTLNSDNLDAYAET